MNKDLLRALEAIHNSTGIPREELFILIEQSLAQAAARQDSSIPSHYAVSRDTGEIIGVGLPIARMNRVAINTFKQRVFQRVRGGSLKPVGKPRTGQ